MIDQEKHQSGTAEASFGPVNWTMHNVNTFHFCLGDDGVRINNVLYRGSCFVRRQEKPGPVWVAPYGERHLQRVGRTLDEPTWAARKKFPEECCGLAEEIDCEEVRHRAVVCSLRLSIAETEEQIEELGEELHAARQELEKQQAELERLTAD